MELAGPLSYVMTTTLFTFQHSQSLKPSSATYHFLNLQRQETEQKEETSVSCYPGHKPLLPLDKYLLEEAICSLSV